MAVLPAAIATVYTMLPVFLLTIGPITVVELAHVVGWVLLIRVLARSTTGAEEHDGVQRFRTWRWDAKGSALGGLVIGVSGHALLGIVFADLAVASGVAMWLASRVLPAPTGN